MRRRAFLGATGAVLAVSSSGCIGGLSDALDSSVVLGRVTIDNYDSVSHRFRIQVRRDGTVVHDSTHEIRGESTVTVDGESYRSIGGTVVERTWGEAAGSYALRGRVDDDPWVEQSVDEALDGTPDCATVRANYGDMSSEKLDFLVRPDCDRTSD